MDATLFPPYDHTETSDSETEEELPETVPQLFPVEKAFVENIILWKNDHFSKVIGENQDVNILQVYEKDAKNLAAELQEEIQNRSLKSLLFQGLKPKSDKEWFALKGVVDAHLIDNPHARRLREYPV